MGRKASRSIKVISDYSSGKSVKEIADNCGIDIAYVYRILKSNNIELRERNNIYNKYGEYILNEYNRGVSIIEIADNIGVHAYSVYRVLRKMLGSNVRIKYNKKTEARKTKINKDEAIALYNNGASITELAERYSVSLGAINHVLRRNGVKVDGVRVKHRQSSNIGRPKKTNEEDKKNIVEQYKSGVSVKEIAANKGICIESVYKILRQNKESVKL